MASAISHYLALAHFKILITEVAQPLAVRRFVSFSEVVYERKKEVEGITARLVDSPQEVSKVWQEGQIAVVVDPEARIRADMEPHVVVDAILAKKNLGTKISDAPLVIGIGPGFCAGQDVHIVVETNRGHNLGRLIFRETAEENTGVPGNIGGFTLERVLRAPADGVFFSVKKIGERARAGETVGQVQGRSVEAKVDGVLRGLLREGSKVHKGWKLGDVDPRGEEVYCHTISEKGRAIAGGVLAGIMLWFNR